MIRQGEPGDIDTIVNMACEFWAHTIYTEPCDPSTVADMAGACIENGMMAVLDIDGVCGFACGVIGPLLGNRNVLTGTEIAWWVNPENRSGRNGVALLKFLESLAREKGVKYWNMAFMQSSMPEAVEGMYQKLGYERTEVVYTKVL